MLMVDCYEEIGAARVVQFRKGGFEKIVIFKNKKNEKKKFENMLIK